MNTSTLTPAQPALNQGQRAAAEAFFQFLFSDDREMIISGPGGVGKTFLMGYLIDTIMPRYYDSCKLMGILPEFDSVEMTATTNKAAEALSLATSRPTQTIHAFLNLTVKDDYSTGESKLMRTASWIMHERKILFIDESSMVDTQLLDQIRSSTLKCKIVYVGDHCQLAPIKETLSPIYRQGLPFYELTEPMRTGDPDLLALNKQLRNTVETGDFRPIQIVPGVIDWLTDVEMQHQLQTTFAAQTHDSRILAYTNNQVVLYNDFIREVRQLPDEFTVGEFLVNNTAIRVAKNRTLSVEEEVSIAKQSSTIEDIEIEAGVFLKIRRSDLRSKLGEIFPSIPVPVDRAHFDALLRYYKGRKNWTKFFHLKNNYPELRQRDAATVHKTQGSTLDTVFVDLSNISTCNLSNQVARMLYVAVSRPRSRIFLYGNLAEKYGGLIH